ncbi:MAG: RNA polymerase sigma factor [Terracidiphilus sp.]
MHAGKPQAELPIFPQSRRSSLLEAGFVCAFLGLEPHGDEGRRLHRAGFRASGVVGKASGVLRMSLPSFPTVVIPSDRAKGVYSPAAKTMLYSFPLRSAEPVLQFQAFDAGYVARLCAGDSETQGHFVAYFTGLLQVKLRSRLQSRHAIDDVCQETFARVFAVLGRDGGLRQPERLGPFVNTVCNHVLLEHFRSSRRSESLDADGTPELPALGANALDVASARQLKDKVREILLEMEPRDRDLLSAIFLEERDRDEVCRQFSVDRNYLRVLLHRAKQEFKIEYIKRIGDQAPLSASA